MRPSDLLSGIQFAADRHGVKSRGGGGRRERVRKLKRCTGLWGMLVCGCNEHPEPASCRATVECVCVCVCGDEAEHIIRPAAARRPNNRPRTHTNRNTSPSKQKAQITKGGGVPGRPAARFQLRERLQVGRWAAGGAFRDKPVRLDRLQEETMCCIQTPWQGRVNSVI